MKTALIIIVGVIAAILLLSAKARELINQWILGKQQAQSQMNDASTAAIEAQSSNAQVAADAQKATAASQLQAAQAAAGAQTNFANAWLVAAQDCNNSNSWGGGASILGIGGSASGSNGGCVSA